MARIASIVILITIAASVGAVPGQRIKRGFNNSGYSGGDGGEYGRGSDERDASVRQETPGHACSEEDEKGGSPELTYNRGNLDTIENLRGGGSFSKASATASASSSYLNQNQKNNVIV